MRIRWTQPAVQDLTRICDYILERNGPEAARRAAVRVYEGINGLTHFPFRGRTGRTPETRELVFPGLPYLAIYRVGAGAIEVLRILHGAQQWPPAGN